MRIKDRTRETAEIEPNRPDHSRDLIELRILLSIKTIQPDHKYYAGGDGFSAKCLEKSIFFVKMTGPAIVWPASSDFWKTP